MKKILFLVMLGCFVSSSYIAAQKITISIPKLANKKYAFVLNKGIDQDTIQEGQLNIAGGAVVNIPQRYKGYVGIGVLKTDGENSINLIINNENFTLEQGADNKNRFKNSPENDYLNSVMNGTRNNVSGTSLYAPRFVELLSFTQQLNAVVNGGGDLNTRTNARIYAMDKLDIDRLYQSGLWHIVVDRLVRLSPDQEVMARDMVKVFKRVKSQAVFEHLADNVVTILNQYGWDDAFDIIVPYIIDSKRIPTPQGPLFDAFKMAKIRRGNVVPAIVGLKTPLGSGGASKTLIMFYESDCHNCIGQIKELKARYSRLKSMNVRVVTISADYNKKEYEKEALNFPWSDKLCDYKGFAGKNFSNYGVMGTPIFYLLDKDLKLIKRFALLKDAGL